VLVSVLLGATVLAQFRRGELNRRSALLPALLAVSAPALGLAAYAAYTYYITGDALAWMHAQSQFGRDPASPLWPFTDIATFVRANGLKAYVLARRHDFLNATAVVFAVAAVIPVARRLGWGAAVFVVLSLLIPLTAGGLFSMGRFTSVLFPIFIWLGGKRSQSSGLIVAFATFQGLLAASFFTDR